MQLGIALYNALESEMNQQLATKQDLVATRQDLKQEISQLETRLTVRMGYMGAGIIGIQSIIMALLKVFA